MDVRSGVLVERGVIMRVATSREKGSNSTRRSARLSLAAWPRQRTFKTRSRFV